MRLGIVIPAYLLTIDELRSTISGVYHFSQRINVVINQIAAESPDYSLVSKEFPGTVIRYLPSIRGKAEAVRVGLEYLRRDYRYTHFAQLDGHSKQPSSELLKLVNVTAEVPSANLVIANRYDSRFAELDEHRQVIVRLFSSLMRSLGLQVLDTVCGMRIYDREFVEGFLAQSYSQGYGLEVEQLAFAATNGLSVKEVEVRTSAQATSTSAEKLEDNLAILLHYRWSFPNERYYNSLLSMMTRIKRRQSFLMSIPQFNREDLHVRFTILSEGEDGESSYQLSSASAEEVEYFREPAFIKY